MPVRRQTRPRRVKQWDDPPPYMFVRPRRRLTLSEGETAAGTPHAVGVDWWGRVWDNHPARQPPPYPEPEATWREEACAVHALLPVVTDVCWGVLLEPGEVHATARWPDALRRIGPGPDRDRLYEVLEETLRLAGDWEQGHPRPARPPPLPLARGGTLLPPTPPPTLPGAPALGMETGPECLTTALQDCGRKLTCMHAWLPLYPHSLWALTFGGRVFTGGGYPSPPPFSRGCRSYTPPPHRCWVFPPLLLLRWGTASPTRVPCAWRWPASHPCVCTGTRSPTGGRTSC